MQNAVILGLALILLGGLLYFETKDNTRGKLATKTPLSLLFIVTALLQPCPHETYFYFLLIGLVCCLGGDVFLAIPKEKTFLLGLISFLLGHVFYVVAFSRIAPVSDWLSLGAAFIILMSAVVFFMLRPFLGRMLLPVLVYVIVISVMLIGAWAVFTYQRLHSPGQVLVLLGAAAFYASDLCVARDRFIKREPLNRFFGLPLYYCGQFLLAYSVGQVC